ncbi:HPr-rel-A system PqqD family peptide chaperone [Sphingomonas sp. C8-2]|nr:HPr-rel-A system PqqD family peptide chaperone [Sphingomonas sp. C8-2]
MTTPTYRTDFPQHCRTHPIDGMTLVFHRPSGATHFLDSPLPQMLALLAAEPIDAARLTTSLCATLGLPEDAEARAVVEARLTDLAGIGLVEVG